MIPARASSSHPSIQSSKFWKDQNEKRAPEKNYLAANMKHIRQISSSTAANKHKEPLKVKFIPGVTKNSNYDHVESRVTGLIRGDAKAKNQETQNSSQQVSKEKKNLKPIWGGSVAANARRINSSPDVRMTSSAEPTPVFKRRSKVPTEESVYNWRFVDNGLCSNEYGARFAEAQREENPAKFSKFKDVGGGDLHVHRVEYLPCDGICADENFEGGGGDSGSARSTGSSKTSRGMNTEETRIFAQGPLKQSQSMTQFPYHHTESSNFEPLAERLESDKNIPTQSSSYSHCNHYPTQFQSLQNNIKSMRNNEGSDPLVRRVESSLSGMKLTNGHAAPPSVSSLRSSHCNNMGGDESSFNYSQYGHKAGEVPKYLKKRQQQWKEDEIAQKEADELAKIPHGHILMKEEERVKTLQDLQSTYRGLLDELNRLPITNSTMKIRDHKGKLEKELTRLENCMKLFSRPNLYVKL